MTKVSSYFRMIVRTGEIEQLPFSDIDGVRYGVRFERGEGVWYPRTIALEIVNHWNYINSIQPSLTSPARCIYWIER